MRGFLITLLALPAVLAAPAPAAASDAWPTTFPISTVMCRCSDGASKNTIGSCLYFGQRLDSWCYPTVSWSPHMDEVFTADYCQSNYAAMPIPQCTPVKLCQNTLVNDPNYFQVC
ncbi:hypothetical protein BKA65DRAFT_484900 [Rhexocercosporidium sp. MPI-PUGE-AT-0058]|nr:hypothetical protein BKA65DRAFT_484900 [Rhexocercosporidium sp. MPI-PUGE-AT-0058]